MFAKCYFLLYDLIVQQFESFESDFQWKIVKIWFFYEKFSLFQCAFMSYLRVKIVWMHLTLWKPVFLLQRTYWLTGICCFLFKLICSHIERVLILRKKSENVHKEGKIYNVITKCYFLQYNTIVQLFVKLSWWFSKKNK